MAPEQIAARTGLASESSAKRSYAELRPAARQQRLVAAVPRDVEDLHRRGSARSHRAMPAAMERDSAVILKLVGLAALVLSTPSFAAGFLTKVRYRGLAKNTAQLHTLFALTNLWVDRK